MRTATWRWRWATSWGCRSRASAASTSSTRTPSWCSRLCGRFVRPRTHGSPPAALPCRGRDPDPALGPALRTRPFPAATRSTLTFAPTHLARPGVALLRSHSLQLMRLQLLSKLKDVGGGKVPKDADIIDWANATVAAAGAEQTISSFKDSSIGSGCVRARDRRPSRVSATQPWVRRAARPHPPPSSPPPPEAPCLVVFPRVQHLPAGAFVGGGAPRHQPLARHAGRERGGAPAERQVSRVGGACRCGGGGDWL